jgi:glycosyltransferase involved in cell wall biosynthesis
MRILMLTSTLPRFAGDMQANFVGEQAAAWAEARPDDEIHILAPHDAGAARADSVGRVQVERFRYFAPAAAQRLAYPAILPNLRRNPLLWAQVPAFVLAEYRAAKRLARRIGADCTYAHWIMPQGLVAWRLKRSLGIPYVLQNHSSDLAVFDKAGAAGRRRAQTLLREAAHFFCVNAAQRDQALAMLPVAEREAFARKCTVLPMGIAEAPAAPPASADRFDVATIGRLSRKKGIDLLLRAAEALAARGLRPRIGIAGDGEERARLEALVGRADVAFAGFITGADKERFLASADRFAFPALAADGDVEGLPVALLEALARGAPVLASRDTNIELLPEWPGIRDEVVFVEDPADIPALEAGLERLLEAEPSATVARAIGRYRWNNLIREYLAAIDGALA